MDRPINKKELYEIFERFRTDPKRGISLQHFAEMCGCSVRYLYAVFVDKKENLSPSLQIRISKILKAHQRGELRTMENPITKKRKIEYRPGGEQKPRLSRAVSFVVKNGKIGLSPGIVNRQDFSRPNLDDLIGD